MAHLLAERTAAAVAALEALRQLEPDRVPGPVAVAYARLSRPPTAGLTGLSIELQAAILENCPAGALQRCEQAAASLGPAVRLAVRGRSGRAPLLVPSWPARLVWLERTAKALAETSMGLTLGRLDLEASGDQVADELLRRSGLGRAGRCERAFLAVKLLVGRTAGDEEVSALAAIAEHWADGRALVAAGGLPVLVGSVNCELRIALKAAQALADLSRDSDNCEELVRAGAVAGLARALEHPVEGDMIQVLRLRGYLLETVGHLSEDRPSAVVGLIGTLVDQLDPSPERVAEVSCRVLFIVYAYPVIISTLLRVGQVTGSLVPNLVEEVARVHQAALTALEILARSHPDSVAGALPAMVSCLQCDPHISGKQLQQRAARAIGSLAWSVEHAGAVVAAGAIGPLVLAADAHGLEEAAHVLAVIAREPEYSDNLVAEGALGVLAMTLRDTEDDQTRIQVARGLLGMVAGRADRLEQLERAGGPADIILLESLACRWS